ncbi:DUF3450 domain-containing protein [bacterium]|nr:DUF3450 domain-containing protein [bacterium]
MTRLPSPFRALRLPRLAVAVGALLLLAGAGASALRAQDPADAAAADRAREATAGAVDTRQATQQRQDAWQDEQDALAARFRSAKAGVAWLQDRRDEEQARVAAAEARVAELARRLDEAERLEASLQDTLLVIFDRLAADVDRSLPFLPAERQGRLESLSRELVQPDTAAGEKLRRLLEALQVETGYGATVEVYQDRITVGGEEIFADILRLGRVALFWRTPDGDRVGTWDPGAAAWTELSGAHKRNLGLAVDMATRRRPVELVELPLGRVAP